MISNSGHDENGKYSGGKAGDQTGAEWQIQAWYSRPWTHVFRYPVRSVGELIAELAIEAANNEKIGYNQNQRTTFWTQLEKSSYHPKNITMACEADCSAGVAAIVKAVGYLTGRAELQNVSKDMYTGSQIKILSDAGFELLTDTAFLNTDKYLLPGDILLCKGHHTAINLSVGSEVEAEVWRWVQSGGKWYYQNQNGKNVKGWAKIKETQGNYYHMYWFDNTGAAVTGWRYIDGKLYLFMPEGPLQCALCISNTEGEQVVRNLIE